MRVELRGKRGDQSRFIALHHDDSKNCVFLTRLFERRCHFSSINWMVAAPASETLSTNRLRPDPSRNIKVDALSTLRPKNTRCDRTHICGTDGRARKLCGTAPVDARHLVASAKECAILQRRLKLPADSMRRVALNDEG